MQLKTLIKMVEKKYPLELAYEWDNVGLIVGDIDAEVENVLVTLEANESIIDEAIKNDIDLIITHHPFIFGKINRVSTNDFKGKLIHKAIKSDIAIYSMHTNFDIAFDGLNDYFMEIMGYENSKVLDVTKKETLYKVAVYVPNDYCEKVREAICNSGAGYIGNYKDCTFNIEGEGTFKPLANTNAFIGKENKLEKVLETKIETIVPQKLLNKVISEIIKAHPYEEVAYDIYELENKGMKYGLGRIATLKESTTLQEMSNDIKEKLDMSKIRVVGNLDTIINKVAVVTGSGGDMAKKAKQQGAQVIITGDVRYHDAQDALDMNMTIIDCGHFESEDIFKDAIKRFLDEIEEIKVIKSEINLNPFNII